MLLLHFLSRLRPDWSLVSAPHSGSILPAAASEWGWTRVSDLSGCSSHQYRPSSSLSCSPGDLERLCLGVWVWGRMRGHRWVVLTVFYVPLEQVTGAIHQSVFYTGALQGVRGGLAVLAGAAPVIRLYKHLLTLLTINLHFIPPCSAQHSETQLWTLIKTVLPRPVFIQAGVGNGTENWFICRIESESCVTGACNESSVTMGSWQLENSCICKKYLNYYQNYLRPNWINQVQHETGYCWAEGPSRPESSVPLALFLTLPLAPLPPLSRGGGLPVTMLML